MSREKKAALANFLDRGLKKSNRSVDELADRTKVPRTTIRALLDRPSEGLIPERVYLRGHLSVLADDLRLDRTDALARFDEAFPVIDTRIVDDALPHFGAGSMAVAAGLAGVAILAVVLAFASALG